MDTNYDMAAMFSPAIAREYASRLKPDPRQAEYNRMREQMEQVDIELEVDHFLRQHTLVGADDARDLQEWFDA